MFCFIKYKDFFCFTILHFDLRYYNFTNMQRVILMLQFFFFIFLENVIRPSTFLHEDKKTNLYQQPKFEMFLFFLSRFTQKQKLPLFSPTFQYFGSNFLSFYCLVILHMCIIFSYFLDFFSALKSHLLLFPFQIPFVHNFLENQYFP